MDGDTGSSGIANLLSAVRIYQERNQNQNQDKLARDLAAQKQAGDLQKIKMESDLTNNAPLTQAHVNYFNRYQNAATDPKGVNIPTAPAVPYSRDEQLQAINSDRTDAGLPPVTSMADLGGSSDPRLSGILNGNAKPSPMGSKNPTKDLGNVKVTTKYDKDSGRYLPQFETSVAPEDLPGVLDKVNQLNGQFVKPKPNDDQASALAQYNKLAGENAEHTAQISAGNPTYGWLGWNRQKAVTNNNSLMQKLKTEHSLDPFLKSGGTGDDTTDPAPTPTAPAPSPAPQAAVPQADTALQWAKSHPEDPRSQKIMQRLGVGQNVF